MKKILLPFIVMIFFCTSLYAQPFCFYADTAHYLMNEIEGKKGLYTGKPLSVLLDSLKIKPVFLINADIRKSNYGSHIVGKKFSKPFLFKPLI